MKYRLYEYDLWGNQVNDVRSTIFIHEIKPEESDESIIRKVYGENAKIEDFSIDGDIDGESYIWIDHKGIPDCELRPEADHDK